MSPLELITNAIAAGALARIDSNPEVTRAYSALEDYLAYHYSTIDLTPLAKKPESKPRRDTLLEDLQETTAVTDLPLLLLAAELSVAVAQYTPNTAQMIAVDLDQVQAELIRLSQIQSSGTAIRVHETSAKEIIIDKAQAGANDVKFQFELNQSEVGTVQVNVNTGGRDEQVLRQRYLNWLEATLNKLQLDVVDPEAPKSANASRLKLSAVYTPLFTHNEEANESPEDHRNVGVNEYLRISALECLNQEDKLVLLGDPGSGKSTFIDFVTLCLAGQLRNDAEVNLKLLIASPSLDKASAEKASRKPQPWRHGALLPVRVILRDFAAAGLPARGETATATHLWNFIESQLAKAELSECAAWLHDHLHDQGGLILLDGLDEVPEADHRRLQIKQAVTAFANSFSACRFLVTARTYAYRSQQWRLPGFQEALLAPFNEQQISHFIQRWYTQMSQHHSLVSSEDMQGRIRLLTQSIQHNDALHELATTPLLLTLIATLHAHHGGTLPNQREKLYSASVDLLMDRWEHSKIIYDPSGKPILQTESASEWFLSPRKQILEAIEELAFTVQCTAHADLGASQQSSDIEEMRLLAAFYKVTPNMNQGRVIEYVRDRAGLLINHAEGLYRFPHRSFQEYMAARYLTRDLKFPKRLLELTRQDPAHWREVVRWAALRAALPSVIWGLVQRLCPQPTSQPTGNDWALAILAGQVLAETGLNQSEDLDDIEQQTLQSVLTWLTHTVQQEQLPLSMRISASSTLGNLGDPRPGIGCTADGIPEMAWVTVEAGNFLIGSPATLCRQLQSTYVLSCYPVTVAQYHAFFAAGGYHRQRYWTQAGWDWCQKEKITQPQHYTSVFQTPNHPQVGVSWYEAVAFCRWLSEQLGKTIRLPTEIEWERAARHNDGRTFPWGNEFQINLCNTREMNIGTTIPVGFFPVSNAVCGAADMAGNVWEWCSTPWQRSWDADNTIQNGSEENREENREEKIEEIDKSTLRRVLRGGSFSNDRQLIRCAQRHRNYPDHRAWNVGFRVVWQEIS